MLAVFALATLLLTAACTSAPDTGASAQPAAAAAQEAALPADAGSALARLNE